MLYDQIRYAELVRKLYRLRHLLTQKDHPDIGSRVGYPKYSKQFYRIKKKLQEEGILDKQGKFVDSLKNLWLVELPLHAKKKQIKTLGHNIPYSVFLAAAFDSPRKMGELSKDLNFNRMGVYKAVAKLKKAELVAKENSKISVNIDERIHRWLLRYIELCKTEVDTTSNISALFNTVPAYISGPQAYYMLNYEPGRPAGPADMIIMTYKPFLGFWESVIRQVRYFKDYPKMIDVKVAKATDEIVWIDRLPYSKKAKATVGV